MRLFKDEDPTGFSFIKLLFENGLFEYEQKRLGGYIAQSYTNGVPNKLHHEIMHWLQENKDISFEDKLAKIKLTLIARGHFEYIFHLAAMNFFAPIEIEKAFDKGYGQRLDTLKAGKEIAENLANERIKKKNKSSNAVRVKKYQAVWNELKPYWQANLTHIENATEAARKLEKTDIYKNSDPKPKREVIAQKIREWKKALNAAS